MIEGADPHLEMGALYELSLQKAVPPVLLFPQDQGFSGRPSRRRATCALRACSMTAPASSWCRTIASTGASIPRRSASECVDDGPVLDNVLMDNEVDMLAFPAPKWHGNDGGQYIGTECMVIAQDPDSDWVNAGTYRVSVRDKKTLSIFIEPGKHADLIRKKWWARGEHCPMVVSVGQAPALGAAGGGDRAGACLRVRRRRRADRAGRSSSCAAASPACRSRTMPSSSTRASCPRPQELTMTEGPFGEWPGYYTSCGPEPVLQVKAIYHRNDPIQCATPPARPIYPGTYFGTAGSALIRAAALWDDLEAAGVPGIKGVWKMPGGGSRFINVIAIEQLHAGHAKMAGLVGGRLRVEHLSRPHHHHRRRRHRHHQSGAGDVGGGDALGPQDRDRHHRRRVDRP